MPARLNKRHQQFVRDKIRASQLVRRLTKHALGEIELTQSQVRSIEILLKKCVPDLSSVEMTGQMTVTEMSDADLAERIARLVAGAADEATAGESARTH